jgi:hypothetical protein
MAIRAAPEGLPMVAFTTDAESLDLAGFVARHGNAFLVQLSGASQTTAPGVAVHTGSMRVMVYPIIRLPTSPATREGVSIGRIAGNDVVLKDDTLSRHHATFFVPKSGTAGAVTLLDENSSNGTAVQGMPVSSRGKGEPTPIEPGQTVRCGTVTLSYVDAAGLIDYCRRFRGSY